MTGGEERRRADRMPVDAPGVLELSAGRRVEVRILNVGPLGALVQAADLEEAVVEDERAVLVYQDEGAEVRTAGRVVRVELEFQNEGVLRQLAIHFDGGDPPA